MSRPALEHAAVCSSTRTSAFFAAHVVLLWFVTFVVLLGCYLSWFPQHDPGVGDTDVGLREAAGRPRRTCLRSHRARGEAGEKSVKVLLDDSRESVVYLYVCSKRKQ